MFKIQAVNRDGAWYTVACFQTAKIGFAVARELLEQGSTVRVLDKQGAEVPCEEWQTREDRFITTEEQPTCPE